MVLFALVMAVVCLHVANAATCINKPTMFTPTGPLSVVLDSDSLLSLNPNKTKYNCFDHPYPPGDPTDVVEVSIAQRHVEEAYLMVNTIASQKLMSAITDASYQCGAVGIKYLIIESARICELMDGQVEKAGGMTIRPGCDTKGNCKGFDKVAAVLTYSCNQQARHKTVSVKFSGKISSKCKYFPGRSAPTAPKAPATAGGTKS